MIAALLLATATPVAMKVDAVARGAGLAGEVLVGMGGRVLLDHAYGTVDPVGGVKHKPGERWRLASITKQVTAAYVVRNAGDRLDRPIGPMPDSAALAKVTLRQLLQHHSGLANPDETPPAADVPAFYRAAAPDVEYCLSKPAALSGFNYNNCDYIVAAALLSTDVRRPFDDRWPAGMKMASPGDRTVPGFVAGKPEPVFKLATFGAAGGLTGTARAVFDFDRSLMTGKLLPPSALAELWKPEGNGSYQALGQWVFPGQLRGCAAPKRIVQRDGEIYGVQARNFIFPDDGLVVILFTNRSADDFKLGEVWEQSGFVYDLLSAAACG